MHREVIYHSANTEKLLGTTLVSLILTYSFLDRLVAVTIVKNPSGENEDPRDLSTGCRSIPSLG